MEGLLILLLFPLAWPFLAKRIWNTTINWQEMVLQIFIVTIITTGVWQAGKYGQTEDTEIWNGQITAKSRDHGQYTESYDCNCHTTCSGSGNNRSCSEECDTCYREHYTVTWAAKSTIGSITFEHLDRTSTSVYATPDPATYTNCKVGEPAAGERTYTNYVQAVPESLFHDNSNTAEQFKGQIPAYPRVYGFYKINRVLTVGTKIPESLVTSLNDGIGNELKTLGPAKQVNVIMILTEIDDPTYRYAIENAWLGGEKNDVVIFIGVDGTKITWADEMTWALNSGNELFHEVMVDGLKEIGSIDSPEVVPFIGKTIATKYDRPQMKDYAYLKDAIEPPTWVIVLAILLAIGGSIGLTVVFHKIDVDLFNTSGYGVINRTVGKKPSINRNVRNNKGNK